MSELRERINADFKAALKNKDAMRKELVQLVRAGILQIEKDQQIEADDGVVLNVIQKEVKKRRELLDEIGDERPEASRKIEEEIKILDEYLPKALSEAELTELIKNKIEELGATSMRDMGRVMKAVLADTAGRAEGGDVSRIVKGLLS